MTTPTANLQTVVTLAKSGARSLAVAKSDTDAAVDLLIAEGFEAHCSAEHKTHDVITIGVVDLTEDEKKMLRNLDAWHQTPEGRASIRREKAGRHAFTVGHD
jgi:hypothetical protein